MEPGARHFKNVFKDRANEKKRNEAGDDGFGWEQEEMGFEKESTPKMERTSKQQKK